MKTDINQITKYLNNDLPISPTSSKQWLRYLHTELKQALSEKLLLQAENERLKTISRQYEEERT